MNNLYNLEANSMNVLRKEEVYTIDDIYALPDGERAELIDGQIYYMDPPSRIHQKIRMFLFGEISNFIKKNHGGCEVYAAPFAVFLNGGSLGILDR